MKTNLIYSKQDVEVEIFRKENAVELRLKEMVFNAGILQWNPPHFKIETKEGIIQGAVLRGRSFIDVHTSDGTYRFNIASTKRHTQAHAPGSLSSPMPGKVLKVLVKEGDRVEAGETLMVLEAMKMEHKIVSPQNGKVEKIFFKEGDRVGQEINLLMLDMVD